MSSIRPRRSVLYMPGANPRAHQKARSLAADGLIFDLEDAVAPDAKDGARKQVCETLLQGGYGAREIIIRVNGLTTPWGKPDLRAAANASADAVLLPKVEDADMVRQALAVLEDSGWSTGRAIWCMIETPRGVLRAEEIAAAHPRVNCLVMGTSDLAQELRASHTVARLPMLTALGLSLLAARSSGCAILDGVHLDLQDEAGFEAACKQGAELGFDGKTLIHPKQIETANAAFAPTSDELQQAHQIVDAHRDAVRNGRGVVVVDGRLIEQLHVTAAQQRIELAKAIDTLGS